ELIGDVLDMSKIEADRYDLPDIAQVLDSKLFGEDVVIASEPDAWAGLQLHGPASAQLLGELGGEAAQAPGQTPGTHHVIELAGVKATVYRNEPCGVLGFGIWCKADDAAKLWQSMLDAAGYDPDAEVDASFGEQRRQGLRGRPVGWEAFNTARIEAGTPLFHVDFGPDSLPGETGLLESRVSFTKGCYLGQEIVARMQNLGHPKRMLAGFRVESDALPVAGTQVLDAPREETQDDPKKKDPAGAKVIGGITSSTASPLLGGRSIGLAVMQWGKHTPGTPARVAIHGKLHDIEITQPGWLES
ncbi:MAG: glycine cleavage T C-terminal barrel domain-containing protein, partial [Phycisphaeraceae bacterium]